MERFNDAGLVVGKADYETLAAHFEIWLEQASENESAGRAVHSSGYEKALIEKCIPLAMSYMETGGKIEKGLFARMFKERRVNNYILVGAHIVIALLMISFIGKFSYEESDFFDYMGLISVAVSAIALVAFDVFRCRASKDLKLFKTALIPRMGFKNQVLFFRVVEEAFRRIQVLTSENAELGGKIIKVEAHEDQASLKRLYRQKLRDSSTSTSGSRSSEGHSLEDSSDAPGANRGRSFYLRAKGGEVVMRMDYGGLSKQSNGSAKKSRKSKKKDSGLKSVDVV